jgi:predicted ATP-dependent Lon-type protease
VGSLSSFSPDEQFDNSELKQEAELALEYRRRVRDWLHKLSPSELTQNIVRKAIEDFKKWLESEKLLVLNSSPALSAFPRSVIAGLSRSP